MVSEDSYCPIGDKKCRHLSVNVIIEREMIKDEYGFPIYKKGNVIYKINQITENREFCNDAGKYIHDMHRCPLVKQDKKELSSLKNTRQQKLEDMW
jgi:hypothetical protein